MKRFAEIPFVGLALLALLYGVYGIELGIFAAWLLRVPEINSVFDRLLPSLTATDLAIALGCAVAFGWALRKLIASMLD